MPKIRSRFCELLPLAESLRDAMLMLFPFGTTVIHTATRSKGNSNIAPGTRPAKTRRRKPRNKSRAGAGRETRYELVILARVVCTVIIALIPLLTPTSIDVSPWETPDVTTQDPPPR